MEGEPARPIAERRDSLGALRIVIESGCSNPAAHYPARLGAAHSNAGDVVEEPDADGA